MKKAKTAKEFLNNLDVSCEDFIQLHSTAIRSHKLNLDPRIGILYLTDDHRFIIADAYHVEALNFHCEFGRVDDTCIIQVGEYTFYSADDEQIAEHIDFYLNSQTEEA